MSCAKDVVTVVSVWSVIFFAYISVTWFDNNKNSSNTNNFSFCLTGQFFLNNSLLGWVVYKVIFLELLEKDVFERATNIVEAPKENLIIYN